jgi:SulP family sulfate permease
MVSIGTFSWDSIRNLHKHPPSSSLVMLATVAVVLATHDLAKGVLVGVLLSGVFFAQKVGRVLRVDSESTSGGQARTYWVVGQVFFVSADAFTKRFDFQEVLQTVRIDVSHAHFWDITAINALDKVVLKFRRRGTTVEVMGLSEASASLVERFAVHDKPDPREPLKAHH